MSTTPLSIEVTLLAIDKLTTPAKAAMRANSELSDSLEKTRKRLAELDAISGKVVGLQKLEGQLEKAGQRVTGAQARLSRLTEEIDKVGVPTEKLNKQFERAIKDVERLSREHTRLTGELANTKGKLHDLGITEQNSAAVMQRLRTETEHTTKSLEQQTTAFGKLLAKEEKLHAIRKNMAAARGGMQNSLQMQQDIAGVAYPALATGTGILYGATRPVMQSANLSDAANNIAITGNMTRDEERGLRENLRQVAIQTNQEQSSIAEGVNVLVANGMEGKAAAEQAKLLGKTATASRATMDDVANVTFSLQNSMKISGKEGMEQAMNNLVIAGKQGQFELKEMARYLPSLSAQMASMGATGQEAVKELAVAMQAARKSAGTSQEAAANMANWFSHMTASSTIGHFKEIGIDYKAEVQKRMTEADPKKRMSAFRASLDVFDSYVDKMTTGKTIEIKDKKGKVKETLDFRQALAKAQATGNEGEVRAIVERFGLSKVIQDMQTANFYLAMRQNKDFIDKGMAAFDAPGAAKTLDNDFQRRLESPIEQFKAAKIELSDTLTQLGDAITPMLTPLLKEISSIARATTAWAKENPELVATMVKVAAVVGVAMVSVGGIAMTIVSILGPLALMRYSLGMVGSGLSSLNVGAAGVSRISSAFGALRMGISSVFGVLRTVGTALMLIPQVRIAMLLAAAGYMVYKNWDVISATFEKAWVAVKTFSTNAYNTLASLPGRMLEIGRNVIDGLISGMQQKWQALGDMVKGIATSLTTKFKDTLGIKSPSRVFMEIGGFSTEGIAIGMQKKSPMLQQQVHQVVDVMRSPAVKAANDMHFASTVAFPAKENIKDQNENMSFSNKGRDISLFRPNKNIGSNITQSNKYEITINAQPGMSSEDIANAVAKALRERDRENERRMRGRLFDAA